MSNLPMPIRVIIFPEWKMITTSKYQSIEYGLTLTTNLEDDFFLGGDALIGNYDVVMVGRYHYIWCNDGYFERGHL